jgi:hypothetical protein
MSAGRIAFLALLVSVLSSGCAFSRLQTSRQLEAGEMVVSGAVDLPGFFILPRVGGQVMYGLDKGDVGASLSTAFVTHTAGVNARRYLSPSWNAGLQAELIYYAPSTHGAAFRTVEGNAFVLAINPRLTSATTRNDRFYGGIQSNILIPFSASRGGEPFLALVGAVAGLEFPLAEQNSIQFELTVSPVGILRSGVEFFPSEGGFAFFQWSAGMNFVF